MKGQGSEPRLTGVLPCLSVMVLMARPLTAQATDTLAYARPFSAAIVFTVLPESHGREAQFAGWGAIAAYDLPWNVRVWTAAHSREYGERCRDASCASGAWAVLIGGEALMAPIQRAGPIPYVRAGIGFRRWRNGGGTELHYRIGIGIDFNRRGYVRPRLEIGLEPEATQSVLFGIRLAAPARQR